MSQTSSLFALLFFGAAYNILFLLKVYLQIEIFARIFFLISSAYRYVHEIYLLDNILCLPFHCWGISHYTRLYNYHYCTTTQPRQCTLGKMMLNVLCRDFSVLRVEFCVTCLFLFKYVTKNGCNYSVKVFDACVMNEEGI